MKSVEVRGRSRGPFFPGVIVAGGSYVFFERKRLPVIPTINGHPFSVFLARVFCTRSNPVTRIIHRARQANEKKQRATTCWAVNIDENGGAGRTQKVDNDQGLI